MKKKNTDLIGGLIMTITAIFFWSQMGNFTKFARIFPYAIILALFISGIGLLIKAKLNPSYAEIFIESDMAKMIQIALIGLAWVLLLNRIGFVITSFFALGSSILVLEAKKTKGGFVYAFLIAAGEVAVFYFIFSELLLVPLPKGILF